MSVYTQFVGGAKPVRVTTYTSGSGTFTPISSNTWATVTLVGGGGGGRYTPSPGAGKGGKAGGMLRQWTQIAGATAYSVGAGGGNSSSGGNSTFGPLTGPGGVAGAQSGPNRADNQPDSAYFGAGGGGYGGVSYSSYSAGGSGGGGMIIIEEFGP